MNPSPTPSRAAFAAILAKDLRSELRSLRSLPAMVLFAVTTFVIFRFGLDRTSLSGSLAAGVLLATLLFAAVLGVNRIFVAEAEEGGFDGIRLAPVDRTVLFAAKASALFAYLIALEVVTARPMSRSTRTRHNGPRGAAESRKKRPKIGTVTTSRTIR